MSFSQHLKIQNLGPIKNCELDLNKMMVLAGPQAAGKSTIAKLIFFFLTLKNELVEALLNPYADPVIQSELEYRLRRNFKKLFSNYVNENTQIEFKYAPDVSIKILGQNISTGGRSIQISKKILDWTGKFFDVTLTPQDKPRIIADITALLNYDKEVVYIPAGRSMISILSEALSHVLFNLDDDQKMMMDYCVIDYINRVTKIKPEFRLSDGKPISNNNRDLIKQIQEKIVTILQGQYTYSQGREFLKISTDSGDKEIALKFTSSGQQEILWILNLIYYYLHKNQPTCFIIEEPEAHLYPNTQKEVAEFIALALAENNQCLITTHSPYILGTFSNLLDARRILEKGFDLSTLLQKENLFVPQLLRRAEFSAYFVDEGLIHNAIDEDTGLIMNELIDGASDKINGFADDLIYLEREGKSSVAE